MYSTVYISVNLEEGQAHKYGLPGLGFFDTATIPKFLPSISKIE